MGYSDLSLNSSAVAEFDICGAYFSFFHYFIHSLLFFYFFSLLLLINCVTPNAVAIRWEDMVVKEYTSPIIPITFSSSNNAYTCSNAMTESAFESLHFFKNNIINNCNNHDCVWRKWVIVNKKVHNVLWLKKIHSKKIYKFIIFIFYILFNVFILLINKKY